jgi:hypothetical protein
VIAWGRIFKHGRRQRNRIEDEDEHLDEDEHEDEDVCER